MATASPATSSMETSFSESPKATVSATSTPRRPQSHSSAVPLVASALVTSRFIGIDEAPKRPGRTATASRVALRPRSSAKRTLTRQIEGTRSMSSSVPQSTKVRCESTMRRVASVISTRS